MKIFNIENNIEKVYVQLSDLNTLFKYNFELPNTVYQKFTQYMDKDMHDFIEFSGKEEVTFFKKTHWIVNYRDIKKLPINHIRKKIKILTDEYEELLELAKKNRKYETSLIKAIHTLNDYITFLNYRNHKEILNLPNIPDSENHMFEHLSQDYNIGVSFEENKIFFSKKDGTIFNESETIPNELLNEVCILKYMNEYDVIPKKHKFEVKFSDDYRYITAERVEIKDERSIFQRILNKKDIEK